MAQPPLTHTRQDPLSHISQALPLPRYSAPAPAPGETLWVVPGDWQAPDQLGTRTGRKGRMDVSSLPLPWTHNPVTDQPLCPWQNIP